MLRLALPALALAVSGCGGAAAPASAPTIPPPVLVTGGNTNPEPLAAMAGVPVLVTWSSVRSSTSCFFFSGPGELGRDDHLGPSASLTVSAPTAELVFAGGLRFTGTVAGATLAIARDAPHEYGGTWTTRETLRLSASGDAWVGAYHYDELDPSTGAPSSCHIDAAVLVSPAR